MPRIQDLILHSDDQFLAAAKPAGMATVPGGWDSDSPSLLKVLEGEYGRLWIVHRLDKVTSGVVVFARSAEAHRALSLAFESHAVHKTYVAIVNGTPEWNDYACRLPLLVDVGHNHRTVINKTNGQVALTRFRVRERYAAHALLEASPETGRTHQIRAHISALGFPVLADTLYRAEPTDLINRPALHAQSLTLTHPVSGQILTLTAPIPADFAAALARLKQAKLE
jgi:tRNA pseudouridine32 synthase/23S rRNA pseudouridine746 synthase